VWCLRNSFTTPGTYVQAKPFIPVILSDARRSAATKRESKNPEDFSFIHTASGSSHNAIRAAGCCFLPFNYHFLAIFGDLGNAPSGSAEIMRLRDSVLSQFAENVLPCGPERRASPAKPGGAQVEGSRRYVALPYSFREFSCKHFLSHSRATLMI
jgi:hypothetical protein